MTDFWQASGNGLIINLDHVVGVDRPQSDGPLRVLTVVPGLTFTIKAGSPEEASLLSAIGERVGSSGQLIAALGDIRELLAEAVGQLGNISVGLDDIEGRLTRSAS